MYACLFAIAYNFRVDDKISSCTAYNMQQLHTGPLISRPSMTNQRAGRHKTTRRMHGLQSSQYSSDIASNRNGNMFRDVKFTFEKVQRNRSLQFAIRGNPQWRDPMMV